MSYGRLKEYRDTCCLNEGTDERTECVGYCKSRLKSGLFYFCAIISMGLPLLLAHWKPTWRMRWKFSKCGLTHADSVLLKSSEGKYFVAAIRRQALAKYPPEFQGLMQPVQRSDTLNVEAALISSQGYYFRYFVYQHVRYVWNWELLVFQKVKGYDENILCKDFYELFKGLTDEQRNDRSLIFGENCINVDVKSYKKLMVEEILNPFYIFQIFSITLWSVDDYYYFAACIFAVSVISIGVSLYKTRKQSETIHTMVTESFPPMTSVLHRHNGPQEIPSKSVVPGDVLVIPPTGCTMACDAVLIAGNCIVNESMLTGESIPVTKTSLLFQDGETFCVERSKQHVLFSGTKVIQTRFYGSDNVLAVVIRTGFSTAKGDLIRSILFPRPVDFKFYKDSMKFIGVLTVIASLGMMYCTAVYILKKASVGFILKRVLDVVTIVVPPALPAAITVGALQAQNRLKLKNIFCTSPARINMCGKLNLFCFDKTGTLTEEGLDFLCVIPVHDRRFLPEVNDLSVLPQEDVLMAAMACCHSLTIIEGELAGDPLDVKMFEATKWTLSEVGSEVTRYDRLMPTVVRPPLPSALTIPDLGEQVPFEIGVLRQFPFSSSLQMMSVVTRTMGNRHMDLYAKGSPEKIVSLCQEMTVPTDVNQLLHYYTIKGFRVLALARKKLGSKIAWHQVQRMKREKLEKDLVFLGLIIMQNTLKRETTPVIQKLNSANIRMIMVTGDSMHTAISVARECGIVSKDHIVLICKGHTDEESNLACIDWETTELPMHESGASDETTSCSTVAKYRYAIDGKSFSVVGRYFPEVTKKLVVAGTIYARMAPEQKTQLVELLQAQDYIVGMCGDGANDCGALKAAHVGISLSDAEASVAAPFTSKTPNIECIPTIVREGRCALVTTFSVFKYMGLYSIIQFISVLILYTYHTNLADTQFLYIDLAITTSVAVFMGYSRASDELVEKRPSGSLLGSVVIASIFLQILLSLAFQVAALAWLFQQTWFVPASPKTDVKFTACYEETVIFCVSSYQYLIVAVAFSRGKPFRSPLYKNVPLLLSLIVLTAFSTLLLLYPGDTLADFFQLIHRNNWTGMQFRLTLVAFPFANLILSILIEAFLHTATFKRAVRVCVKKQKVKCPYKKIAAELKTYDATDMFGPLRRPLNDVT